MKRFLNAETVIDDIEFELLQGAITRDELGHSIRLVKKHLDELRTATFDPEARLDRDETIARLLQLNDMLLTLLQEFAKDNQAIRLELRKLSELTLDGLPTEQAARDQRTFVDMWKTSELDPYLEGWPPQELEDAIESETLLPEMVLQPPRIPIIGGFLNRFRIALHNVAIFYVARLAERQGKVNATYGTWIERLVRHSHEQQEKIRVLTERVEALQGQLSSSNGVDKA